MKSLLKYGTAAAVCMYAILSTASAQTVLRFAHTQPTTDTHQDAAERFAEIVEDRTNGEITVDIHPGGELGSDPATLEGVRLGTIDIGVTGNPFFTRFAPKLNVIDLPYLFSDYDEAYKILDGEVGDELLGLLEDSRMKGLAFWEIGFRKITNSVRPIETPADLEGLKIRTTPNEAHIQAFELWGASPTPMAFTELYSALETGTVDGQENPLNIIRSNQFQEVQKYLSYTNHAYTSSVVAMNLRKFQSLTPEQQDIVVDAAHEAAVYQRELNREQADADLAAIEKSGVEVIQDIDEAAFKDVVYDAVRNAYAQKYGDDILTQIDSALGQD